ncbi:MAG: M1 family peptidase, partial [Bacteroidota bacterium]|nr:M1 family peptidase [Bacteroidota bacterium]
MFLFISTTKIVAQYWQQFVNYKIDVALNPETAIYSGKQTVEYKNNSPETLKKVFFHLYFNAFQPGSEMAVQQKNSPDRNRRFKVYVDSLSKNQQGYLNVSDLTQDGVRLESVASETILEVPLNTPIPPG